MAGSCEHSDKYSGSIKCGKYFGNYTFVRKVALRGVGQFVVCFTGSSTGNSASSFCVTIRTNTILTAALYRSNQHGAAVLI